MTKVEILDGEPDPLIESQAEKKHTEILQDRVNSILALYGDDCKNISFDIPNLRAVITIDTRRLNLKRIPGTN